MPEPEKPKLSTDQISNIYGTRSTNLLHHDQIIDAEKVKSELEIQKKKQYHINFLEKLGISTSLVGWFYMLLIPALVFLFGWSGKNVLIYYYIFIVVPICAEFIISGKFITYNGGKLVKYFLIFNSIIGLLTLPTLLSGIVGIQSIMAYFYYKKEMNSPEPIPVDSLSSRPKLFTILLIIIFSAVGCYGLTAKNPSNPMFGPIGFLSDITNNRYYSSDKKFSVDMRYHTTVKKDFDSVITYKIPNTSYICGTKDVGYAVIDHDYSSLDHDLSVVSTLDATYQMTTTQLDAKNAKESYKTFKGLKAKFADFTFFDTQSNHNAKSYYVSFIKNNHVYELYTISLTETDFNKFIDSFRFEK